MEKGRRRAACKRQQEGSGECAAAKSCISPPPPPPPTPLVFEAAKDARIGRSSSSGSQPVTNTAAIS